MFPNTPRKQVYTIHINYNTFYPQDLAMNDYTSDT